MSEGIDPAMQRALTQELERDMKTIEAHVTDLQSIVEELATRIKTVRDVHWRLMRRDYSSICGECRTEYPCATVRHLNGERRS